MLGIVGAIALLTTLGMSLVVTRVAAKALILTGLDEQVARFQARSAMTGTGFTTEESEAVVRHPVRRRILLGLMVLRSAGLFTIVISLILSFANAGAGPRQVWLLLAIVLGIGLLWYVSRRPWFDRLIQRLVQWRFRDIARAPFRDYAALLRLEGEYAVSEVRVSDGSWLDGQEVSRCGLADEGIVLLGIVRPNGRYVGAPRPDTELRAGDVLRLYGREENLEELKRRRAGLAGERSHQEAVREQSERLDEQERQERQDEKHGDRWSGDRNQAPSPASSTSADHDGTAS
jgi:hypothetical protein